MSQCMLHLCIFVLSVVICGNDCLVLCIIIDVMWNNGLFFIVIAVQPNACVIGL